MIKPISLGRNPHLGGDQFTRDDFTIDYQAGTVTCPAGETVTITANGGAHFKARCRGCPLRDRCTSAKPGRTINVGEHDQLLAAARTGWAAR